MQQVLGEDVEVVAVGVKRCDAQLGALTAVVAVVVIGVEARRVLIAEDADQAARQRRLARARVTHDSEHDRPGHRCDASTPVPATRLPPRRTTRTP